MLLGLVGSGVYSLLSLPIDAVPDITNVQVMALTNAPALGPEEVEQFITIPVENAMNGIPRIKEVRSFSQFGISGVTIIFEDGTDIYWARQQVGERLDPGPRGASPRSSASPRWGRSPPAWARSTSSRSGTPPDSPNPRSLMELRTILDWEVARPLKSVPGVVEVNALGGELKTYEVELDPNRLHARGIALNQVFEAIRRNNAQRRRRLHPAQRRAPGDPRRRPDRRPQGPGGGRPRRRPRAGRRSTSATWPTVRFAPMIRQGAATRDGRGEAVTAIVLPAGRRELAGSSSTGSRRRSREIQKDLPEGVVIDAVSTTAATLIEKTIATVARNLAEGGVLVVAVLLVLLGNLRAGPDRRAGDPALDALRRQPDALLRHRRQPDEPGGDRLRPDRRQRRDRHRELRQPPVARPARARRPSTWSAARRCEVRRPVVFGVAIITLVHLPILALEGVEGKMFRPMAADGHLRPDRLAAALADGHAGPRLVLPQAGDRPSARPGRSAWPSGSTSRSSRPRCGTPSPSPWRPSPASPPACRWRLGLGGEFIPQLDEGDLVIAQVRPPSASLDEAIADTTRLETALRREFPAEIRTVVSRIGRPEIGLEAGGREPDRHLGPPERARDAGRRPAPRTS